MKHWQNDGQLLVKNDIEWSGVYLEESIPNGAESVIRQPANRKLLGMRIPMFINGLVRPEVLEKKRVKRIENGKDKPGLRNWIANGLGEPPVIYDPIAKERTERNLEVLSHRAGFLDARCRGELTVTNEMKVALVYRVFTGPLYTINELRWDVDESGVSRAEIEEGFSLPRENVFDADQLELERSKLAQFLKSRGYASLDETHISFLADTSSSIENGVDLTLEIRPAKYAADGAPFQHRRSRFRSVEYIVDSLSKPISKHVLDHLISIDPGTRFNEASLEMTYRRLMGLPSLARVEMPGSIESLDGSEDAYDVSIKLIHRPRYGVSAALDMTRTDARYGPMLTGVFKDRNVSGKGDVLELVVSAGITSSQPFSYSQTSLVPNSGTWSFEAHYSTLGIPPVPLMRLRPSNAARTDLVGLWSRESRPEYSRNSIGFKYGFYFVENPTRDSRIHVDLVEFTYANIDIEPDFKLWLDNEANPFIQNRFQDYASILSRIRWTSKWMRNESSFGTVNVGLEWTGWGLNALAPSLNLAMNESSQYLLGQVPFVQFIRCEGTWTGAKILNRSKGLSLHGRVRAGAGWAGDNFNVLPFDRSFFSGSANGVRGWPARQLGPGHSGYNLDELSVVKGLGDLLGEVSFEFRRKPVKTLEWAWFVDAGNVWLMDQSVESDVPNNPRLRWSSIGLSSGIGLRLDFDFFLFRLDGGLRIHDPGLNSGNRWIGQHNLKGGVHLGIGHHF